MKKRFTEEQIIGFLPEADRMHHLTQQGAAELLGMTQPKLSEILRDRFRGISQTKMVECLNRLGRDMNIMVRKANRRAVGHTQVMVA